jgi:hypothetical protein
MLDGSGHPSLAGQAPGPDLSPASPSALPAVHPCGSSWGPRGPGLMRPRPAGRRPVVSPRRAPSLPPRVASSRARQRRPLRFLPPGPATSPHGLTLPGPPPPRGFVPSGLATQGPVPLPALSPCQTPSRRVLPSPAESCRIAASRCRARPADRRPRPAGSHVTGPLSLGLAPRSWPHCVAGQLDAGRQHTGPRFAGPASLGVAHGRAGRCPRPCWALPTAVGGLAHGLAGPIPALPPRGFASAPPAPPPCGLPPPGLAARGPVPRRRSRRPAPEGHSRDQRCC